MSKLTEADCEELERKARNCRDNARAELVVADAFMPEYRRGLSGHPDASAETHKRSMELYDFAIKSGHRARDYERDAALFDAAAEAGRRALQDKEGE